MTIDVSGSADSFNGANLSRSVAENSAAGTAVGDPVTGTPYDDGDDQTNDALTYTLTARRRRPAPSSIDSATGQISVKQGATIDYETKTSYTGRVNWTRAGARKPTPTSPSKVTDIEAGQRPTTPTVTRTTFERADQPGAGRDLDGSPPPTALTITATRRSTARRSPTGEHAERMDDLYKYIPTTNWHAHQRSCRRRTRPRLTLPNLEAGATYEVQVRAVTQLSRKRRPLVGHRVGPGQPAADGARNRPTSSRATPSSGAGNDVGQNAQ